MFNPLPPPILPPALLGSIPFVYMLIRAELFQQLYRRIHFQRASIKNDNEYGKWKSILSNAFRAWLCPLLFLQLCFPLSLTNFIEQTKKKKKQKSMSKSLLKVSRNSLVWRKKNWNWNIWKI